MARYRGTVEGNRSEASRLGTIDSGLTTECNGWSLGAKAHIRPQSGNGDGDTVSVRITSGSGYNNTVPSASIVADEESAMLRGTWNGHDCRILIQPDSIEVQVIPKDGEMEVVFTKGWEEQDEK